MGTSSTSFIQSKIGNPFFFSNNDKDSEVTKLLSEFNFVSTYQDDLFQRCSIIEHKQSKQLIVAKEIDCTNQAQMDKTYTDFQNRKQTLTEINLLRLRYVLKKKTDGIFSDEFKIVLFFDYIIASLEIEYKNRIKNNRYFSAQEINIIMTGGIRGYSALEEANIPNNKVRLKNIYFGLETGNLPITKIIDSKLFPDGNNTELIRTEGNQSEIYLAPEQLKSLKFSHSNNIKSGVYSFGMCMIQLCLLNSSLSIYNYSKQSINYQQIETRLNIIKNKYPLSIFYLIRQMVERSDMARPSFKQLAEKLPNNIKTLNKNINLSILKKSCQTKSSSNILPPGGYTKLINPNTIVKSQRKLQTTTLASQYRPNVEASQVYTNGSLYTGQKRDNLRHGKGKYVYNDGSYYFGDWLKGKMEGTGQLYDIEGNLQYEGEWKNDHYEGHGKLMGSDGDWVRYEGEFKSGRMEGFGEIFYQNKSRYKGQFRANLPWGKGRKFNPKGELVQTGFWEQGNYISEL